MASTSPASASLTAVSTACPATRPARMVRARSSARSPLPSPQVQTPTRRVAGSPAIWSSAPTSVISASSGCSRARPTISGPIPRGSPRVMASRVMGEGSLRADIHVRRPPQSVDVALDRELLAELVADAVAHVLEPDVSRWPAAGHLHHDELGPGSGAGQLEHRRDRPGVGLAERLGIRL